MTYIRKYIPKTLGRTWCKILGIAMLAMMLQGSTLAQFSSSDFKALLRERNAHIIESLSSGSDTSNKIINTHQVGDQNGGIDKCIPTAQTEILPYMYHYIRPTERDPAHSVVQGNSITPEMAKNHFAHLDHLQQTTDTRTILLSELDTFKKTNCFPSARVIVLIFDDGRRDNYNYLRDLAFEHNIKANLGVIVDRISRGERIDPFMKGQEIQEMIDSGYFEIASHSWTHTDLRKKNRNQQYKEICESKTRLEEAFGVSIKTFVYPMGLYNSTSTKVAQNCGYSNAFTTHTRHRSIHAEIVAYPFELSRIRTHRRGDGPNTFPY